MRLRRFRKNENKRIYKKVKSLGYEVEIRHDEMRISCYGKECVCIDLKRQFGIYIYPQNLRNNGHRLFVICMEYARMPVEDRGEDEAVDEENIRIESFYNHMGEKRYRIIRLETGEVHDGNGYGYKSVDKALKAYSYIRNYLS